MTLSLNCSFTLTHSLTRTVNDLLSSPTLHYSHSNDNERSPHQHPHQQHHHKGGPGNSHWDLAGPQHGHTFAHSLSLPHCGRLHVPVVRLPQFWIARVCNEHSNSRGSAGPRGNPWTEGLRASSVQYCGLHHTLQPTQSISIWYYVKKYMHVSQRKYFLKKMTMTISDSEELNYCIKVCLQHSH